MKLGAALRVSQTGHAFRRTKNVCEPSRAGEERFMLLGRDNFGKEVAAVKVYDERGYRLDRAAAEAHDDWVPNDPYDDAPTLLTSVLEEEDL